MYRTASDWLRGHWELKMNVSSSITVTQNRQRRQQWSSWKCTLRSWSGPANLSTEIGWRRSFQYPSGSQETWKIWRVYGKRSEPQFLLRCLQSWWLCLLIRVSPPSSRSCFAFGSNTYFTHWCANQFITCKYFTHCTCIWKNYSKLSRKYKHYVNAAVDIKLILLYKWIS